MLDILDNPLLYIFGLIVTIVSTVVYVVPKHDTPGFHVIKGESFYYCEEVKQDAVDHRLAICVTADECNRICDKYRSSK